MLVGEVPFNGQSDYMTFQMILNRKLKWPTAVSDYISESAKDLVDKLL